MSVHAWKDASIPKKQLALNLQELTSKDRYPDHWKCILKMIPTTHRIIDIGCGVGSIARLLEQEGFSNSYLGIDFSESMIECASQQWKNHTFVVGDVMNLTDVRDTDIILCNGLLDILPNAVEVLRKILGYKARHVILSRVYVGAREEHGVYDAYGIPVPKYTFSQDIFHTIIKEHGYSIQRSDSTFFLTRMKNIAIIVPTRTRPGNIQRMHEQWFRITDATIPTECVIVLDEDDEKNYPRLDGFRYIVVKTSGTRGVVYPLNHAALQICDQYEYLGFWGDDHYPLTPNWNSLMYQALQKQGPCAMVYGDDGIQGINLPTHVVMDSKIVTTFGYMGHPAFRHLHVDDFWKYVGMYLGTLIYMPNVKIEHKHYCNNKAPMDALYATNNSEEAFLHGHTALHDVIKNVDFIAKIETLKRMKQTPPEKRTPLLPFLNIQP